MILTPQHAHTVLVYKRRTRSVLYCKLHTSRAELARVYDRIFSCAFSSWAAYTAAMRPGAVMFEEAGAHADVHHRTTEVSFPQSI